jgi:NDP-sugar pyrophosphorylase family protein
MMTPVNGMLLAAGRGDRMEPLSSVVPKPALDVLGEPLLASALGALRRAGCERIAVNLHRNPGAVAAAAREAGGGLLFSWEPDLLGSAGGVAAVRPLLGDGPMLVANADTWSDLDLARLLRAGDDALATLALVPHPDPTRWSSVVLADDGTVRALLPAGAPATDARFLFTGFQLLGAEVVRGLPPPPGGMAEVWDALRSRRRLRGVVVPGAWREAGSPLAYRDLVLGRLGDRRWVHPQATVAEDARVERSAVGAGCRVERGAEVVGCVLTAGASVGAGSTLAGCVLAGTLNVAGQAHRDELIVPGAVTPLV